MPYDIHTPTASAWDAFVRAHADAHILQLSAWGTHQSRFGWQVQRFAIANAKGQIVAGAQVLLRRLPLRLGRRAYLPAAPLFSTDEAANDLLWRALRRCGAAFLKVEPCDWYRPRPDLPERLTRAGLRLSPETIQQPRTIVLDLSGTEDDILRRMNQSTRYKCRLGQKKEVAVRLGTAADAAHFGALMQVTAERDSFYARPPAYYQSVYEAFAPSGEVALLIASHAGQDLAAVMVFRCGETAYYLYGASSNAERNRMPTYIVQWEAIRWAKAAGALRYDLWGVPDVDEATLEANFEERDDGLWGVYKFKRGFGGALRRSVGAWDLVNNGALYALYLWYVRRQGGVA
ncbi:MAG: peptidoglycan bridge formation glycyltransferase FemA/FemB family protein [Chloroflexi bacterium CFX4]|nr:peptidoglycan bridge formation glycyltransferase FemA/FemB family protein [Chloroflexi bacterium CFX4]MDL1921225.1 peptidoglycan bridge formation glycyltransferase FemA/FemB family protein [Chloroflexi bacterium CFX3]